MPIGTQDLSAHVLPRAGFAYTVPRLISPFAALRLAKYSLPRPLGTAMPQPAGYQLASFESGDADANVAFAPPARAVATPSHRVRTLSQRPKTIAGLSDDNDVWPQLGRADRPSPISPTVTTARLYFGTDVMDAPANPLQPSADEGNAASPAKAGRHVRSPAVRLSLTGRKRKHAVKCLADAIYFEARGESVRGQIAVGQVVMNRVFSEYYPGNVCDVVYQNADHHLACQFTFACDGIPEVVTEPEAWRRAKRIANDILDGKLWLKTIGWATHYHADWVHPSWVHEMRKLDTLGVHIFYRPRAWGSGADEPVWGDAKTTAALVKKL